MGIVKCTPLTPHICSMYKGCQSGLVNVQCRACMHFAAEENGFVLCDAVKDGKSDVVATNRSKIK